MVRIFVLFKLKPGVAKPDYEAWARATDLPIVRNLPSIAGFDVFETTGVLGSETTPLYDYIEVVDVKDMDQFGRDIAEETMQRVAAEFRTFGDAVFLTSRPVSD